MIVARVLPCARRLPPPLGGLGRGLEQSTCNLSESVRFWTRWKGSLPLAKRLTCLACRLRRCAGGKLRESWPLSIRRAGIAAMMSPSYARNCSVTPTPRSERLWLMRVSRRTQARPALAAVRSRPNWICRNACFVAGLADSWRIGTATLAKNLERLAASSACQPVERHALARFARAAPNAPQRSRNRTAGVSFAQLKLTFA